MCKILHLAIVRREEEIIFIASINTCYIKGKVNFLRVK